MACDITHVFLTFIRALRTTGDVVTHPTTTNTSSKDRDEYSAFSFHRRATNLRANLQHLSTYLKRVQKMTGSTIGSNIKQKMHSELMEQISTLVDQCTTLLGQLKEVSSIDESTGKRLTSDQEQIKQHRSVVFEYLEENLNKLRYLRDAEVERQRHLRELTGTLAAGVRSVSPLSIGRLMDGDSNLRQRNRKEHALFFEEKTHPLIEPNLPESELQSLERENRSMYEHLSEQRDDFHLVARAINEIGKLNLTLSTHLSEQLETVQQIGAQFSTSTENIRQGNESLRSALSSKASAQFWILFIMIVFTFSLHFLDWYYP